MRYPGGDLAILGVETYPNPLVQTPARSRSTRQSNSTSVSNPSEEGGPRKRQRVQGADGGAREKDETKRARGRPRLDVSDETAADVSTHCNCGIQSNGADGLVASTNPNSFSTTSISESQRDRDTNTGKTSRESAKGQPRNDGYVYEIP